MVELFTTSDGAQISYQVDGSGEPICFIHGFTLNKTMWQRQVTYFAKKYQVITFDLRGFGESSLPTREYSYHQDIYELFQYLHIGSCYLVGLSLGGEIAIDFTLQHSTLVKKLVLVDSSVAGFKGSVNWNMRPEDGGVAAAKQRWLDHDIFAFSNKNEKVKQELSKILENYSGWHWLNTDLIKKLKPPARERLAEIMVPTLILVGEHDIPYFHDVSNILVKGIKNAKKGIIPEAGHMVNMDNPEVFNVEVERFLKEQR